MITGFNTDIEFQGVIYHVQTEDKGLETPLILSLVYDRGTILASKRSPYDDLLNSDFDEKELAERLQRQHKLICAAVRAGRIEDLKQMTLKESAAKKKAAAEKENKVPAGIQTAVSTEVKLPEPVAFERKIEEIPAPQLLNVPLVSAENGASLKTITNGHGHRPTGKLNDFTDVLEIPLSVLEDLIIEEVQIIEEPVAEESFLLPVEAVQIISEDPIEKPIEKPTEKPFEKPLNAGLSIEVLNEVAFKSGERKTLSVLVRRGNEENGLSGAHVMVKVLGSSFRPLIFHAKTDSNGIAVVQLQLPSFTRGRAALLVKAMSGGEETELRRAISQE